MEVSPHTALQSRGGEMSRTPPHGVRSFADVWRVVTSAEADAPPTLEPLCRLAGPDDAADPLYSCTIDGGRRCDSTHFSTRTSSNFLSRAFC